MCLIWLPNGKHTFIPLCTTYTLHMWYQPIDIVSPHRGKLLDVTAKRLFQFISRKSIGVAHMPSPMGYSNLCSMLKLLRAHPNRANLFVFVYDKDQHNDIRAKCATLKSHPGQPIVGDRQFMVDWPFFLSLYFQSNTIEIRCITRCIVEEKMNKQRKEGDKAEKKIKK